MKRMFIAAAVILSPLTASAADLTTADKNFIHLLIATQECHIKIAPVVENAIVETAWKASPYQDVDAYTSMIALRAYAFAKALKEKGRMEEFCKHTVDVYRENGYL